MRHHDLKAWPEPFKAAVSGLKPFELRKNDREYHAGDTVRLHEYVPLNTVNRDAGTPTGLTGLQSALYEITYVLLGGTWGLPDDLCILGLRAMVHASPLVSRSLHRRPLSTRELEIEDEGE